MWVLYRTARPPVEYKARPLSCAFLFRVLCLLIAYVAPIAIAAAANLFDAIIQKDTETPSVTPGQIFQFIAIRDTDRFVIYPPQLGSVDPIRITTQKTVVNDRVTDWTLSFYLNNEEAAPVRSLTVVFFFTVKLEKWASTEVQAVGSFTKAFPLGVNRVSCVGDLRLAQSEIIPFRPSFSKVTLDLPATASVPDVLKQQDNEDILFYVDWEEPDLGFGAWMDVNVTFTIRVSSIEIRHAVPLVASLESTVLLAISLMFLAVSAMNALQGFVFRKGIIQAWPIPYYVPATRAKFQ
jgi:hypothetical protein